MVIYPSCWCTSNHSLTIFSLDLSLFLPIDTLWQKKLDDQPKNQENWLESLPQHYLVNLPLIYSSIMDILPCYLTRPLCGYLSDYMYTWIRSYWDLWENQLGNLSMSLYVRIYGMHDEIWLLCRCFILPPSNNDATMSSKSNEVLVIAWWSYELIRFSQDLRNYEYLCMKNWLYSRASHASCDELLVTL